MENFVAYNPTAIHFGKDVINDLAGTIKPYGKKALLIYGKGSAVKYGYYRKVIDILNKADFQVVEYSGIKSNPIVQDADNAVELGIREKVDLIIALGGGSVIDTAKAVALCIPEKYKVWDVVKGKVIPGKAIPIITILTLSAAGTEMNHFSVIQNHETNEKLGFRNPAMFPKHSFLDPQYTYTVSPDYTSYGTADIIAHAFENYFGYGESPLADRFAASIVKECMHYGPLVLKDPTNYEYRANIMLNSSCALNGTTIYGKTGGDWGTHAIGHILSILYDTPHGASLSIAYPAWLKLFKDRIPERIKKLGILIFNTEDVDLFISKLESFFRSINCPVYLEDIGLTQENKKEILSLMNKNKISGSHVYLNTADYEKVLDLMYAG